MKPEPTPLGTDGDEKPIAYSVDGQPLYARPQENPDEIRENPPEKTSEKSEIPENSTENSEKSAEIPKPEQIPEPENFAKTESPFSRKIEISAIDPENTNRELTADEIREKHEESVAKYPLIQFLPDEYVVIDVKRTMFGVAKNWIPAILVPIFVVGILIFAKFSGFLTEQIFTGTLALGGAIFLISLISALVANYVFRQNRLVITNERVFRRLQLTPFSYSDENIELSKIENCSFSQENPLEMMLNYGGIRLSTVGNEKTYEFDYASDPRDQFQIVNLMIQESDDSDGK